MADSRIPDPTLMARLQLSVKGVDWAASLVAHRQHEQPAGDWSARQHVLHLIEVERVVYQPRISAMLEQIRPVFPDWEPTGEGPADTGEDIAILAEQFMQERAALVERFKTLTPEQWARTGVWPDGEVDIAWAAERALSHSLEHFTALLLLHQKLEKLHARQWLG